MMKKISEFINYTGDTALHGEHPWYRRVSSFITFILIIISLSVTGLLLLVALAYLVIITHGILLGALIAVSLSITIFSYIKKD